MSNGLIPALTMNRNWITFAPPQPFNPTQNVFPTEAELRVALEQLVSEGWRNLVTYSLDGTLSEVPRIAKEVGFVRVVAGLFWFDEAQLAREKVKAVENVSHIDGYVLGSEGLFFERYKIEALEKELTWLKNATGKPVTTSEPWHLYVQLPKLAGLGDWLFPNIHPWNEGFRDVVPAVNHTVAKYQNVVAVASGKPVIIHESWWPTSGDPAATETNQIAYFQTLAGQQSGGKPLFFIWGEAYDQFWKAAEGPWGPHWGFHTSTGTPKAIITTLQSIYTGTYLTSLDFFSAGGAPNRASVYSLDNQLLANFEPFGTGYTGGVNVAVGDIDSDGFKEVIVAAATGNPHVRIIRGKAIATGFFNRNDLAGSSQMAQWFPYELQFNVGASVAVGDISNDGFPDVVTGASAGNPHVKVYHGSDIAHGSFDPNGASLVREWFPYGLQFNVGANLAVGDVDQDGFRDVITGATAGNPDVRVYRGKDVAQGPFDPLGASLLTAFFAYGLNFNVGANVEVGDTNGDGFGDVVTGATAGNPHVKVFSGKAIAEGTFDPDANRLTDFFAFALQFNVGVTVGARDIDGDGEAEILTGASVGAPHYRAFPSDANGADPVELFGGLVPSIVGGVAVAI
jgi:exo-beta-1,3-glucanase (GH17 family)